MNKAPKHIAIIMDGNGRWAKNNHQPRIFGHKEGVKRVNEIVEYCATDTSIKILTLYTFSFENWFRPKKEIDSLMSLIIKTIEKYIDDLIANGICIKIIGDIELLPCRVRDKLNESMESTKNNNKLILNLAVNYGSRQEIVHAVKLITKDVINGKINYEDIDEEVVSKKLYTYPSSDPDLLIRTGGEYRLSNFLLWQLSYSELIVNDKYWPDYSANELMNDIKKYKKRERRFGKIIE